MGSFDLPSAQFIVIGDTPNDIDCQHFGARSLAVGTARLYRCEDLESCNPEILVDDFSKLEAVMRALANLETLIETAPCSFCFWKLMRMEFVKE